MNNNMEFYETIYYPNPNYTETLILTYDKKILSKKELYYKNHPEGLSSIITKYNQKRIRTINESYSNNPEKLLIKEYSFLAIQKQ